MNIAINDILRLIALRERFFRCIEDALNEDGHCKSYEGAISVSVNFPPIFDRNDKPTWRIDWSCYVLPDTGRSRTWEGSTLSEALAVAETEADQLCFRYEMERFASPPPEGDENPNDEGLPL